MMTLYDIYSKLNAGTVVSIIVVVLSLVEITPIKFSPLRWIGKRVNGELEKEVVDLTIRVDQINSKLNDHMAESYRNNILEFADSVMHGKQYTHPKWQQMLKICAAYEDFVHSHHLINGDATEGIAYLRKEYQRKCAKADFSDFPKD